MKKQILCLLLPLFFLTLSAATAHKFYMALYQIDYAPEKKMLQITCRIQIDDLEKALEKKYNRVFFTESEKETAKDLVLINEYLSNHFSIKVNEQPKTMNFLSKEIDGDELVCYLNIKGISKIHSLEIYNTVLTDTFSEQQNRINVAVLGTKKSFLLTNSSNIKVLKY